MLSVTSKFFLWKNGVGVLSALQQRLKRWGVSSDHTPHSTSNWCAWLSPLLKTIHKKARKQFAEDLSTKYMDYWNHVLCSDEMKINLFGSDGFKHVWRRPGEKYKDKCVMPTVRHGGGNVIVYGCMSAAGVGELYFIEGNMNSNMYCEIRQQNMIPSLQNMGPRAVFQHDNDSKHTSKTTIALLKRLAKHEPNRTSLGDPQAEDEGVQSLKYLFARDFVMEELKSIPVATCKALVNSMARRVKAVLDNDGGHRKYWQLTWCILILTTFPKGCTHFCWQGFSF